MGSDFGSGQTSSWGPEPSSATNSLSALMSSFPSRGQFLRVWGRQHWFSVLGGPIHVSLVWAIGQGVGDTFPLVAEGCIFSPMSR